MADEIEKPLACTRGMTAKKKATRPGFKVGDRVRRVGGRVTGTVTRVTKREMPGGVHALVRVIWDPGKDGYENEFTVQDRGLDLVDAKEKP